MLKNKLRFSQLSIITKLSLMSAAIITTVIGMACVNLFFTNNIGNKSLKIIKKETSRVINNSQISRDISGIFSDVNLLLGTFLEKENILVEERERLTQQIERIINTQEYKNETFHAHIITFKQTLDSLLIQSASTSETYNDIITALNALDKDIALLEEKLADVFIKHKIKGRGYELFAVDQVMGMIPDYHNMLLRVRMSLEDSGHTYITKAIEKNQAKDVLEPKSLLILKDLEAGFGSVKNAGVELEPLRLKLVEETRKCREKTSLFYQTLEEFGEKTRKFHDAEKNIIKVVAIIDKEVAETTERMEKDVLSGIKSSISVTLLLSGLVFIIVFILFGGFFLNITKPIKHLSKRINNIYERLGFQQHEENRHGDEIERFTHSFEQMASALEDILRNISNSIIKITNMSETLTTVSQKQSSSVKQQSSVIAQTSAAAKELSESSGMVSKNIQKVMGVTNDVFNEMMTIKNFINSTATKINVLSEKSGEIGKITLLIRNIAAKTNLLAVNAAIESAKAGERGKGFAVVANEIQQLSDSTAVSTKEINSLIESMQTEIFSTLTSMNESFEHVNKELELTKESNERAKEISMSASQQNIGSNQIAGAMESIDVEMKNTSLNATQTEETVKQLKQLADELKKLVLNFKTQ